MGFRTKETPIALEQLDAQSRSSSATIYGSPSPVEAAPEIHQGRARKATKNDIEMGHGKKGKPIAEKV